MMNDNNNWGPAPPGGEALPDGGDWRTQLSPDSRTRIVNKIMDTLKKHLPFSGPDGLNELKKVALRFEEKMYTTASNQPDYLNKISLKMLTMESKSHVSAMPANSEGNGSRPSNQGMQAQIQNQVQLIPNTLSNQSQARQQLLPQNIQNNLPSAAAAQVSASLSSTLAPGSSLVQTSSVQQQTTHVQNISGVSQNSLINPMGQGLNSNMFVNQRQMPGRPQMVQQQQSQNPQQYLYPQQMQNQLIKQQKIQQQGNILHQSMMSSHIQQQPQQSISQMQSHSGQLQQQQQGGLSQQHRLQASGSLLQQQNVIDQQKQLYTSQRALPETSLESITQQGIANGAADWKEELYQKIKAMNDAYFAELKGMYQNIAAKLQQYNLPQQPKSEQLDRLKKSIALLQHLLSFLQISKDEITPGFKDKLDLYEKQIVNIINVYKPRKLQQGQIRHHNMSSSMQQPQQSQPQINQKASPHENQMKPQLQTAMNLHNPVPTVTDKTQHNFMSLSSGVSNQQQSVMNSLQHNPSMESGQGNNNMGGSMQHQVGVRHLQQSSVSSTQQVNISTMSSSQVGMNMLQPNVSSPQTNGNVLHNQNLKQQQEQQMLQTQQQLLKQQFQKCQILTQKQQLVQKHQQAKQQQNYQMNERPGMGVKPGGSQHQSVVQRPSSYVHQQSSLSSSSPQLLQATSSPQLLQHSSPQIDQLTSLTKTGTPVQSSNSPFVVPSPSTPLAPSPMPPGDSERPISGVTSHSNTGNIAHRHIASVSAASSLAIGTPGLSPSPLLAECIGPDGAHGNTLAAMVEQPIERLIRVVKSLSSQSLGDAVTDISSVVSMVDRVAGSAPGNGSRAAVGEDLVAMAKCRLPDGNRKIRRYTSAMPLTSAGSVNDSFKQLIAGDTSELESTATSSLKRPRIEVNHVLREQIREINQRLIDTVVDVCDDEVDTSAEGGYGGVIVKCCFNAVALSPNLKSQYASAQLSIIQPLRLLVPSSYPSCSPFVLLDKLPVEVSKEYEDLSAKAKTRFNISLRRLSQPMSVKEMACTWDDCCRGVILEYAEQSGGGSFSSKYGSWESYLTAA